MSADDSTGFDSVAENTVLLGQHRRTTDTSTADATAFLAHKSGYVSQRLQVVLSQCQTESEIDRELWDDFEIHRCSADTYLNQYLDCMKRVHEERSGHVYEIHDDVDAETPPADIAVRETASDPSGMMREQWRLKILRDSLSRDLLAMHETLELLKTRADQSPSKGALLISAFTISVGVFLGCFLWQYSHRGGAVGVVAADLAGVAYYNSSETCEWLRLESIRRRQGKVKTLYQHLNRGRLDERNRADLDGMLF